jgi:Domain of unknown function (DUF1707)
MDGSGDQTAAGAGSRGYVRASHRDREQVVDLLKAAFVQGRLTKDEFDLRVGQVLASRTYASLDALTADLPTGLMAAQPRATDRESGTRPEQEPNNKKALKAWACATVVLPSVVVGVGSMEATHSVGVSFIAAFLFACIVGVPTAAVAVMFWSWLEKRSRGKTPVGPPPGAGVHAPERQASAGPPRRSQQVSHHQPRRAQAGRGPVPRSAWPAVYGPTANR